MNEMITVLLVDDHALVRSSIANWLSRTEDMEIVGESPDADDAVKRAIELQPRIVLMDIDMPGLLCFDAARTIATRCPETRVAFVSAFVQDRYIEEALRAQAAGYITKGEDPNRFLQAVRSIAAGGSWYSPEVQMRIIIDGNGARLSANSDKGGLSVLTPRETEVLRYVARGLSKKEIAALMRISIKTVDNHCTSLMGKLDIHDRVALARFAIREGLVEA